VEDLLVVDGQDEAIGDGADGLVEVGLGSEDVDCGLGGEWGIRRDDCEGDRVEWDRKDW